MASRLAVRKRRQNRVAPVATAGWRKIILWAATELRELLWRQSGGNRMIGIGLSWIAVTLSFATTLSTVSPAQADGRLWLVGRPTQGPPSCEEFFDKWELPGAPPGTLAMAGLGREAIAAKDCIEKNNVPMACKHWQVLLTAIDKMGAPLSNIRGDIEELMRQSECEVSPALAGPGASSASGSEPEPGSVKSNPVPGTNPGSSMSPEPKTSPSQ
jgi:hypothetical protein